METTVNVGASMSTKFVKYRNDTMLFFWLVFILSHPFFAMVCMFKSSLRMIWEKRNGSIVFSLEQRRQN